jgi:HD superfamily phosphohydrolase
MLTGRRDPRLSPGQVVTPDPDGAAPPSSRPNGDGGHRAASEWLADPVFGEVELTEPLLLGLLRTAPVQRLRRIHQAGASFLVRPGRDVTRYEHAVGVMLLIRRLGGSVGEQAAGLIHDVSHTAFSHVADQLFARRGEDYHEAHFERLVLRSEIPGVLAAHGLRAEPLLDHRRWRLLEQPLPELCADRIDYTLRDLLRLGVIAPAEVAAFLPALTVASGTIAVNDPKAALWFVRRFAEEVLDLFMHPLELFANATLADALRRGLAVGALVEEDLFLDDEAVLARLRAAGDAEILGALDVLRPDVVVVEDDTTYDVHAYSKARNVDPLVVGRGGARRCSALYPSVLALHERVTQKAARGVFLRVALSAPVGVGTGLGVGGATRSGGDG